MRGLKQIVAAFPGKLLRRIFYRCVDWNSGKWRPKPDATVASFTDAWIETIILFEWIKSTPVASFTDAWIETRNWKR